MSRKGLLCTEFKLHTASDLCSLFFANFRCVYFFLLFFRCVLFFLLNGVDAFLTNEWRNPVSPSPESVSYHICYIQMNKESLELFSFFFKLTYFLHLSTRMLQLSGKVCPNFKDLSASFLNIKSCISFIFFLLSFLISIPRYHLCQDRHILLL